MPNWKYKSQDDRIGRDLVSLLLRGDEAQRGMACPGSRSERESTLGSLTPVPDFFPSVTRRSLVLSPHQPSQHFAHPNVAHPHEIVTSLTW